MDRRKTTRKEDKTYALMGIFSIHMTLAYGEGEKARERLLHALATQNGDLSFLSFAATTNNFNCLPAVGDTPFLDAQCREASTPATLSHFGLNIEVQLVSVAEADRVLACLESLKTLKTFREKDLVAVTKLMKLIQRQANSMSTTAKIAIVHDIRSILLLEQHADDCQTGGGNPIKRCHRLQCCQIEEFQFERLFGNYGEKYDRIWLGNEPWNGNTNLFDRR
jgi:hypothetical protein